MAARLDARADRTGGGRGFGEGDEIITANVLRRAHLDAPRVHWVIVGGESGPKARAMHPEWARSLRDQCERAGVAFFFKQWGEWGQTMDRLGKKTAGRMLDGRTWDQVPA